MTNAQPSAPSAFANVRVRWFFPVLLFPFLPGVGELIVALRERWPSYWVEVAFFWAYYGLCASLLALLGVVAWKLPVRACLGRSPTRAEVSSGVQLTAFVNLVSIATLFAMFLPLSFVAPEFVQWWLLDAPGMIFFEAGAYPLLANVLSFVAACVLAPVLEEMLFRGIVLPRWTLKWGPISGILASSGLFAVLHLDPIGAFVFGVAMCALYLKSQSLALPILCHALNNLVAWLWEAAYLAIDGPEYVYTVQEFRGDWTWGAICAVAAVVWLGWYARRPQTEVRWRLPVE